MARETLGSMPKSVRISASGNIIKNVKSVVVPNTGGLRGIAAAAAAGIVAGKAEKKLEVLAEITKEEIEEISDYLKEVSFQLTASQSGCIFDIYTFILKCRMENTAQKSRFRVSTLILSRFEKTGRLCLEKNILKRKTVQAQRRSCLLSVSYTHLDVYKRQIICCKSQSG